MSLPVKHYEAMDMLQPVNHRKKKGTCLFGTDPGEKPIVFVITENETYRTHEGFMSFCISLSPKNALTMNRAKDPVQITRRSSSFDIMLRVGGLNVIAPIATKKTMHSENLEIQAV